jgi:hypothetical protein
MGLKGLAELHEKQEALRQQMREQGKTLIADALKEVFEKHPELLAVRWAQYTPYFNDGDACTFRVNDADLRFAFTDDNEDATDGFIDSDYYLEKKEEKEKWSAAAEDIANITAHEDILLETFGNDQEITVNRDGSTEQEEYSHD